MIEKGRSQSDPVLISYLFANYFFEKSTLFVYPVFFVYFRRKDNDLLWIIGLLKQGLSQQSIL